MLATVRPLDDSAVVINRCYPFNEHITKVPKYITPQYTISKGDSKSSMHVATRVTRISNFSILSYKIRLPMRNSFLDHFCTTSDSIVLYRRLTSPLNHFTGNYRIIVVQFDRAWCNISHRQLARCLLIVLPWDLWLPITRQSNVTLATWTHAFPPCFIRWIFSTHSSQSLPCHERIKSKLKPLGREEKSLYPFYVSLTASWG